jgi:hypothetical protein
MMTQPLKRGACAPFRWPLAALLAGALAACSSTKPNVYQHEDFNSTGTYTHDYRASNAATCEAAWRALLSQGYVISQAEANLTKGRKSFQPSSDSHVEIEFNVVCVASGGDSKADKTSSTVFVNALQDRYALKKVNNSASLGVGMLGSLSVPLTSSDDSMVKVASETIPAGQFYDRFFALIERYLVLDSAEPEPQLDNPPPPAKEPQ